MINLSISKKNFQVSSIIVSHNIGDICIMKIATKPVNFIQKIRNIETPQGRAINRFAQGLKEEGFSQIHQREWRGTRYMVSGKKPSGETKSYLLSSGGYAQKTNKTTQITPNSKTREIDKSFRNEYGNEIRGINKFQRIFNNTVFDTKVEKRGWFY